MAGETPYRFIYRIEQARIVAILDGGGGAVVVDNLTVCVEEGRIYTDFEDVTPGGAVLAYYCSFAVDGAPVPDAMVGSAAKIVISGNLSTGGWIEVRGEGHLEYDEHGNPLGEFEAMPRMVVQEQENEPVEAESETSADEWLERIMLIHPKPSQEFDRASAGRDLADLPPDSD